MIYFLLGFSFFIILFGVFLIYKFTRKKSISSKQKNLYFKNLRIILLSASSKEKIIDIDKLYHNILKGFGYEGTFGDILKLRPDEIDNLKKIWELHKLRNKLVHDFDLVDEKVLSGKASEYEKEIRKLLSNK